MSRPWITGTDFNRTPKSFRAWNLKQPGPGKAQLFDWLQMANLRKTRDPLPTHPPWAHSFKQSRLLQVG